MWRGLSSDSVAARATTHGEMQKTKKRTSQHLMRRTITVIDDAMVLGRIEARSASMGFTCRRAHACAAGSDPIYRNLGSTCARAALISPSAFIFNDHSQEPRADLRAVGWYW